VNAARRAIAAEVFAAGRAYDAQQANRLDRLRNLEPETAELLGVLIRATSARRVLEIGTSNGYSTLWLADAVETTGGRVQTLDLDPRRTEQARANLERAGLDGLVDLRTAGAAQALTEYDDDAWDLIFLDAERPEYPGYWANLRRVLAPGATLAIDNAISHTDELVAFNRLLEADPHVQAALVPIGAGLILAVDSD
jgi:predicted O-methyltransferase YrrM